MAYSSTKKKLSGIVQISIGILTVIKFLGENPVACPWDEDKKYFLNL